MSTDDVKNEASGRRYVFDDFNVPCKELANKLLGTFLVRKIGDDVLKGRIVETECYLGGEDKASHSYEGRKSARNEPMYMSPGTCYVYLTYGMYHCFNISSDGDGAAVLLRAIQPIHNLETINNNRKNFKPTKNSKQLHPHQLCNGPAKLCIGFKIDLSCNKKDLCSWSDMWIEQPDQPLYKSIVISSRIGIDSVGKEWASAPLRFYELGNASVSKRDWKAEEKQYPQITQDVQRFKMKRKLTDD